MHTDRPGNIAAGTEDAAGIIISAYLTIGNLYIIEDFIPADTVIYRRIVTGSVILMRITGQTSGIPSSGDADAIHIAVTGIVVIQPAGQASGILACSSGLGVYGNLKGKVFTSASVTLTSHCAAVLQRSLAIAYQTAHIISTGIRIVGNLDILCTDIFHISLIIGDTAHIITCLIGMEVIRSKST